MTTGKVIIVAILGLALVAAITGWVHQYFQTDQIQAVWGPEALELIAYAPKVTVVERHDDAEPSERQQFDVSRVPGMSNIRYTLGRDFAYDTMAPASMTATQSPWRLEFRNAEQTATLDFSADCGYVTLNGGRSVKLVEPAAVELRSFFEESMAARDKTR